MNINGYTAASGSYGFMLPDINTLILNGEALDAILNNRKVAEIQKPSLGCGIKWKPEN